MKICNKCKQAKVLTEFYSDKLTKDGVKYSCIKCHNHYNNILRNKNPEMHRLVNLQYSRTERGRYLQFSNSLRRKFWPHLTADAAVNEYNNLLIAQNHCCALCGKHKNNFKTRLAVDHCHATGLVRGLLCNKCNRFEVGRHTAETAQQLLTYLLKNKHKENK